MLLFPAAHSRITLALIARFAELGVERAHVSNLVRSVRDMLRGKTWRPRRSCSKPLRRRIKNCLRHLPTVKFVTLSAWPTSRFDLPSAQSKIARVRSRRALGVLRLDNKPCSFVRSDALSMTLGAKFIIRSVLNSHFSAPGIKNV